MPERNRLENRRAADNFELVHNNIRYSVSVGFYEDFTTPGEIFLNAGKSGTQLDTSTRDSAIAVSLALQYGCPVKVLAHACLRNENGSPAGVIGAVLDNILESEAAAHPDAPAVSEET